MDQLIRFYKNALKTVAVGIAVAAAFLPLKAEPFLAERYGRDHWSLTLAPFLNSHIVLVGALAASEWFIRKRLWRWRWFHSDLDFSGQWEGTSYYTAIHVGSNALPGPVRHQVAMKQDCLCFRIIPSPDPDEKAKGYWESKATNLVSDQRVVYAYEVHYGGKPNFPDVALGYEDMRVVQRDPKGRPCVLRGTFHQCAMGKTPVYSGSVEFRRVGRAKKRKGVAVEAAPLC